MGHTASLDILDKRKIFGSYQDSIPWSFKKGNSHYTDHATHPKNITHEQAMNTWPWPPYIMERNPVSTGPRASLDWCRKSCAHTKIEFP
jgi:hypothetical protein